MRLRWFEIPAAVALGLLAPVLTGFNEYFLTVLILALVFIILASSWNFLTYSGQGSLGHAAFFGIGGYASTLAAAATGLSPYLCALGGGGAAALAGLLIGVVCVRLKEWFLAMVTFGFAIIVQTLVVQQFAPVTGGWDGIPSPHLVASSVPMYLVYEYYTVLAVTVAVLLLFRWILSSRIGLAFAAIRTNELEARAAGIDPVRYRLLAFTVSAYFAGLAGALEIHYLGFITPEIFGVDISFWPIVYSISGGLGTLGGPVVGTVVITLIWDGLQSLGLTYARFIVIGALLLLIILFLPRGLVSLPERAREWFAARREGKGREPEGEGGAEGA
ncbi:MAG TPA: branched-chain amino acid ABC transporter permease [Methanomicrobiales archaeon]|nr:branched-chain amino acid ABC transporter permease [Methanomicrobiales archaeon]